MGQHDETAGSLFAGSDQTQALLRSMDWAATALGPVSEWPIELCGAVRIMLASKTPMEVNWGPELTRLYNDAARPNLGDRHPGALGRPWGEHWPEMHKVGKTALRSVLGGSGARRVENHLLLQNRSGYLEETYWTVSSSPITDSAGTVGGVLVTPVETTALVLMSRRLQTLRDLGSISTTTARTTVAVSHALLRLLERNRGTIPCAWIYLAGKSGAPLECVGCMGTHARPAELQTGFADAHGVDPADRVMRSGEPELVTGLRRRFRPGTLMPGPLGPMLPDEVMVCPLRVTTQKAPQGVLVVGIDPYRRLDEAYQAFLDVAARQVSVTINDARTFETESNRVTELAELNAEKTRFLQNVSHEFRTPLALLRGPLQSILDSENGLAPEHREALKSAQAATSELIERVDTLLDFIRADAGELHPQFAPTDLAALTTELVELFRSGAERARLGLRFDPPALAGPVEVDRQMWSQIVLNLLSNAFKFTAHGAITVSLESDGTEIQLGVADTGIGLRDDQVDKIFQRFYQADAGAGHGTGIGLPLVADLVHAHSGRIHVSSTAGNGSVFTVTLPTRQPATARRVPARNAVTDAPISTVEEPHTDMPDDSRAASASNETIRRLLLVEDHVDQRSYLSRLLSEDDWTVEAVASAEDALAISTVPDLILADIVLPGRSGIDLLYALRADPALDAVPVLLLTARAGGVAAAAGLQAGANDYVVKPFDPIELLARVRMHYDMARRRRQAQEQTKNLQIALSSSRAISYAIGILMAQRKATVSESFELLRECSRNTNRKLRDIADEVVLTGVLPPKTDLPRRRSPSA